VSLFGGRNISVTLTNPAVGDFDLYLYSATPSAYGTPILLAYSTQLGNGANELLNYTANSDQSAILVVKRVAGSGTFNLVGNLAPAVDFTANVTTGLVPLTVNFTNLTTSDATNFLWNFGDGNTSLQQNPSDTYINPGTYNVTLTAIGPGGTNSVTKSALILATSPPPPVVEFAATPTTGFAPLTVSFTNLTTGATNFDWQFGDSNTSPGECATNIYANPGSYTVTLTAFGPGGTNSLSRNAYVIVSPLPEILNPTMNINQFQFSFDTIVGKTYNVEFTDSLDSPVWQSLQLILGDGSPKSVTNSTSAAEQRFFRLRVE
jgi:PKD repeat protein